MKKKLLIGLGVAFVAYFLWKKSKKNSNVNSQKPCKKWSQVQCITTPCPSTCIEY